MNELEKAAREYASCDIEQGGLKGLRGIDGGKLQPFIDGAKWQNGRAIEAFKENCPCWSRLKQDRKCDECEYLKDFCNQLNE